MSNLTASHKEETMTNQTPLPLRSDTILGVCEAIGQDFDPMWHEAVAHQPANGRRDGEVTDELRRGYRIGQRLLRPAQVRVAKA